METTLKRYYEIAEIILRLSAERVAIRHKYPKYKPKAVKAQYDKLKIELDNYKDESQLCYHLLLLGIPLSKFYHVYAQVNTEVLDFLSRYETDPVLNTILADLGLAAYIKYSFKTKELTYRVELIDLRGDIISPINRIGSDFEVYVLKDNRYPSLHEVHREWQKLRPDGTQGKNQDYKNSVLLAPHRVVGRLFHHVMSTVDLFALNEELVAKLG